MSVVVVSLLLLVVIHIVIFLSSPCLVSFLFMSYHISFVFSYYTGSSGDDIVFTSLSYCSLSFFPLLGHDVSFFIHLWHESDEWHFIVVVLKYFLVGHVVVH